MGLDAWASIRCERWSPPCGLGVMRPSCAKLSCQRRALAGLTPNRFAAWRREAPSLRAETTRSRRSTDKADGRAAPSESRSANQIHTELTTRPDSTRSGAALAADPTGQP